MKFAGTLLLMRSGVAYDVYTDAEYTPAEFIDLVEKVNNTGEAFGFCSGFRLVPAGHPAPTTGQVCGNWTPLKAGTDYDPPAAFSEVTLTAKPWLFGPPQITAEMAADISPNLPVPNLADYLDLPGHDSADTPFVVGPS